MNCEEVSRELSIYHDGELPERQAAELELHLANCESCRRELAQFSQLGRATRDWLNNSSTPDLWGQIATSLANDESKRDEEDAVGKTWIERGPKPFRSRWLRWSLAISAVAAGIVLVAAFMREPTTQLTVEQQFTQVFERYVEAFRVSPESAETLLDKSFSGESFAPETAEDARHPLFADSLVARRESLPGLTRVALHVRNLPCCDCVQALYRRTDGSCVAVFEHAMPSQWSGSATSEKVECGHCVCQLRRMDQQVAATWTHGTRHFTAIGVKDVEELKKIVEQLDS